MKSIKMNALANMTVRIMNIVFPLITGPYLARILNKTDFGNFNVVNTFINFFIPFATFGVYNYGMRVISGIKDNRERINRTFSALFYMSLISTLLTTTVYYIYVIFSPATEGLRPLYYVMGFQIFVQFFYIEWMNEAFENYTFILYKTLILRVLMLVSIFVFVRTADDIIPYAMVMSLTTFANFLVSFVWIKRDVSFVKVRPREMRKLLKPLFALLLLANANNLYTVLDRLFIAKMHEPVYVTYYTLSWNIVFLISSVIGGAAAVSLPRLGYYLGCGQKEDYENLVNKGSRVFSFFIAPVAFGLMVLGPAAMLLYGGEKYIGAGICASLFAIRAIPWSVELIISTQIIFVNGFETRLTLHNLAGGLVNLSLNSVLYFMGVARPEYYILTTLFAELMIIVMDVRFIRQLEIMSLGKIFRNVFRYAAVSAGFIPIFLVIRYFLPAEMIIDRRFLLQVGMTILLCSSYYILIMHRMRDKVYLEFLDHVKAIRRKIFRR
ncbi:MAG: oligosaccharide flippase family protein [Eubacteriales bacterium]|nr:oligosaccharide flippase family protein [Eubacteriales bacterium]